MSEIGVREALSEAIRYWEPRRFLFNAVLFLEVAVIFCLNLPGSRNHLNVDVVLVLFVLAVLANVAYCACYANACRRSSWDIIKDPTVDAELVDRLLPAITAETCRDR
jgi:hypothetical protein